MSKGQLDFPLIPIIVVAAVLLMLSPIMIKLFISIQTPLSSNLGNITGGEVAQANFDKIMNAGVNLWDKAMVGIFIFMIILLILSAFMIDTHPIWVILYIFIAFLLIIFAPNIIGVADKIYTMPTFVNEVNELPMLNFIREHFGELLVGLFLITGVIIYGKIKYFGSAIGGRMN